MDNQTKEQLKNLKNEIKKLKQQNKKPIVCNPIIRKMNKALFYMCRPIIRLAEDAAMRDFTAEEYDARHNKTHYTDLKSAVETLINQVIKDETQGKNDSNSVFTCDSECCGNHSNLSKTPTEDQKVVRETQLTD